jgi:hypothetical protein
VEFAGVRFDGELVVVALFGADLEELCDGLLLAADVAVAIALAAAGSGEDPCEREPGRDILRAQLEHHRGAFGGGEDLDVDDAAAEGGVAQLVDHAAGAIACDDIVGLREPLCAAGGDDAEFQVAAVAGEVERELREVAGVDTEAADGAVDGAIEEEVSVANDEVGAFGTVAKWARCLSFKQRLNSAGDDFG